MKLDYSFIIPVYNRPQEINELLESFTLLQFNERFEIIIVEDGSSETSQSIVKEYSEKLNISYYYKENSGPGDSRNFGMQKAKGNYFIILDSDCLLSPHYLLTVDRFLKEKFYDCYGGADTAHISFTPLQKAINYVMTSFYTTGGIRGSKKIGDRFEPRSFNMGISKQAYLKTKGFSRIHPGEDPDLSQRMLKAGFTTTFIPDAAVFHKRRISWSNFYTQMKKFGLARPILNKWHPQAAKITFWFPTFFIFFVILSVVLAILINWVVIIPLLIYLGFIFLDSSFRNRSMYIGFLTLAALFIQFFGYGIAFLESTYYIQILKKDPEKQFPKLFFE